MGASPGIGGGAAGPWYRVQAIMADGRRGGTAEHDYASVLPAVMNAALHRRPFVAGWLSRGGGAPLELITNAGPLPEPGVVPGPRVGQVQVVSLQDRSHARHDPAGPDEVIEPSRVIDPSRVIGPSRAVEPAAATAGAFQPRELLFPWGARGVPMPGGLLADLDRLVWAPCPGRQAPPLGWDPAQSAWDAAAGPGPRGADDQPGRRPTLFESALVTLMARAFGWLVVAEPSDLIDTEIADLRTQLNVLRRYDEERSRFDAARAERRLAELDAFREAGLWQVRVLVGAASEEELRLIAPMLVGSVDLTAHPYRLRSAEQPRDLADALAARLADPVDGAQVPFAATAGALAALTGLPRGEVPGVRVLEPGRFDVTSETGGRNGAGPGAGEPDAGDRAVDLGAILDGQDRQVGTFRVPLTTLNRHAFVTGSTGSGKSQTVRHLLEQLTAAGVPWLAIEPVKSEYAAMAGRIAGAGQVTVINPSDPAAVPLSVNPLEPEPGYPVQAHIDMVRALFLAAFDAREPFPQIISQALQRAYEDCGWDPVTGAGRPGAPAGPAVPAIAQLQRAALEVIEDVGYGRELRADVRGFVDVRLRSLRTGSAGRFFEGGHPADVAELLRRNVVLAIEDVANDEDKAFLIGTLIIRLVEHLRLRARTDPGEGLRHVIVIEEAHRLLRASREGASAHAVELFASLLAEIRAYGEGIIVVEQIPTKLVGDVVKNTALKVLHRLPAHDDRQVVGAAMNLDEDQSRQVVSLRPGVAAVFADGMDRPLRIRVPFGGGRERPAAALGALRAGSVPGGPPVPVRGRRSAACGPACVSGRACSLLELRSADLLAAAPEDAWLRIWTEALVLAFLTNRALPVVPAALRNRWAELDQRLRECLLATAVDRSLRGRALAVRAFYDPQRLAAAVASTALKLLEGQPGAGAPAGRDWVIPQLQWLHEVERVCPFDEGQPDPFAPAPPLDYLLDGLADRPGLKIGQRVSGLRRHPLSMELARNRQPAWTVLLGEDEQHGFAEDLAAVVIGVSHRGQLRQAAGEMGIVGWLEAVLSWPRRFIVGSEDQAAAAAPSPGAAANPAAAG
ncbi:MAG TPA: ATP-binding protein [Streptosporangiaceae bacterium]|nr:ATP-binding protein [Streptosporangiaceae bacterium]